MTVFSTHMLRRSTHRAIAMLLLGVIAIVLLDACRPRLPDGIIGERKMERVLYDYHMAQSIAENMPPDSGTTETYRYELIAAVFHKHGITEEEFEQSMTYYCSDLQRLNKIYKNLGRRYEREALAYGQTNVRDVYANLSADGDTANVWGGLPIMIVRSKVEENIQSFRQTCDSTWMEGDELLWRFIPESFAKRSYRNVTADLIVYFTNDSVRAAVRHASTGQQFELRVMNPDKWKPKAITGHLYLPIAQEGQEQTVIAATEIMLIRHHPEKKEEDKVKTDSLKTDTLAVDSLGIDSLQEQENERRLSPDERRRQQTVDQKIDIVKEKPYVQPRQRGKRRMQQPHIIQQRRSNRR